MDDKNVEVLGNTEQVNPVSSSDDAFPDQNVEETSNIPEKENGTDIHEEKDDKSINISDSYKDVFKNKLDSNEFVPDFDTDDLLPDFDTSNFYEKPQQSPINKPVQNKYNSYFNRLIKYIAYCLIPLGIFIMLYAWYCVIKDQTIFYTENSHADYVVCLKENNYYQDQCLGPNIEYVSAITDTIRADFNYTAVYQTKAKKNFKYYIRSKLIVKTDEENEKELLSKEKELTKKKNIKLDGNVLAIAETIDIPFAEYNNYAQNYKNDYSLLSNCELIVSLVLKDGKNEKEVSSLSLPLTKLTYSITRKDFNNQVSVYKTNSNSLLKYILIIAMLVSIAFVGKSLKNLIAFLWKTRNKGSSYHRKLKNILNTYDRVIVTLNDKNTILNSKDVYNVETFLELLDVRDTIDKPILYYKVNDIKSEFYVQDSDKTYKFSMKESDFDSK